MAVSSTRELNVKVIFVVTIVSVFLLVAIVYAAQAGFFFFQNRQIDRQFADGAERTFEVTGTRGDNLELAVLNQGQDADLQRDGSRDITNADGEVVGSADLMPIDQAMQQIDDRY